jgi:threonine/homoserine/homoserine lactone efflux protein
MLALDGELLGRGAVLGASVAAPAGGIGLLYLRRVLHQGWLAGAVCGMGAATAIGLCGGLAALGLAVGSAAIAEHAPAIRLGAVTVLLGLGVLTARARPARRALPVRGRGLGDSYAAALVATLASPAAVGLLVATVSSLGGGLPGSADRAAVVAVGLFGGSTAWVVASSVALALVRRPSARLLTWANRATGAALVACACAALAGVVPAPWTTPPWI